VVLPQVREFTRDGVFLDNGNLVALDIVIAATGYRTGLQRMVGKLDVLDGRAFRFSTAARRPEITRPVVYGYAAKHSRLFANARIQAKAIAQQIVRQHR
jgi:hypothetical protein